MTEKELYKKLDIKEYCSQCKESYFTGQSLKYSKDKKAYCYICWWNNKKESFPL